MSTLRTFAGALPPLVLCLSTWRLFAIRTGEWRASLALSTVAVGVVVVIGTELLSLADAVDVVGLLLLYAVCGAALFGWWVHTRERSAPRWPWRTLRDPWVAAGSLIAAALLGVAVASPPNNWDSMTYHMSRIAHWAAQQDVSHYATHIDRQLFTQPWAEYAILHSFVLSSSDRWANVIQWSAMVVTVVMVTLVARNLGLSRRAQVAAAIVVLTLPMGITQAPTTQNDYVAAMWIAVLAALVTRPGDAATGFRGALLVGTVAGLGATTKATTYFFIAPLLLWWLVRKVELRPPAVAKAALLVVIPGLVLTAPGFLRNIDTFSHPLGPPLPEFVNDPVGPQATGENVVRHLVMQFGVPGDSVNQAVAQGARRLASVVGLDLDRPGSTFPPGQRFMVTFGYREDDAQAFAATALLIIAIALLAIGARRRGRSPLGPVAPLLACAAVGAVLLDTYLRWNPWNARYLLPFFVLTAVVTAAAVDRVPRKASALALTALLGSSLLWVFGSDLRPVLRHDSILTTPRSEQYFAARPELREPYVAAAEYVHSMGPKRVGYIAGSDDWEYPLWVLLRNQDRQTRLDHVDVRNASRRLEAARPDVIICTSECTRPAPWSVRRFGTVSVWTKT